MQPYYCLMKALEEIIAKSKQLKCLKRVSRACEQSYAYSPTEGLEGLRQSLLQHLQNRFTKEIATVIRLKNGNAPEVHILRRPEDPQLRELLGYLFALNSYLEQDHGEIASADRDTIDQLSELVKTRIKTIKKERNTIPECDDGLYPLDRLKKLIDSPNSFRKPYQEALSLHRSLAKASNLPYLLCGLEALIEIYKVLSFKKSSQHHKKKRHQRSPNPQNVFPEELMGSISISLRENPQTTPKDLHRYSQIICSLSRVSQGHQVADQMALELINSLEIVEPYSLSKALKGLTYLEGDENVAYELFSHSLRLCNSRSQHLHKDLIISVFKAAGVFCFEDPHLKTLLDRCKDETLSPATVFSCLGASVDQHHDQEYWITRYRQEAERYRRNHDATPNRAEYQLGGLLKDFFSKAHHKPSLSFRQILWGYECDIVGEFPDGECFVVEYDSGRFHNNTAQYDRYRDRVHFGLGIPVVRVSEALLKQMLHIKNPSARRRLVINTFSTLHQKRQKNVRHG